MANCTAGDVCAAIEAATAAFQTWRRTTPKERSAFLLKVRDAIHADKETFATTLTRENGKPKSEAFGEINYATSFLEWFAEEARRQYGDTIPSSVPSKRMITMKQPIGVAAIITPWNFPLAMVTRKVGAALAAGCTCVIKPPEDTPLSVLLFAKVCETVGIPAGVVNVVPCSRERVEEVGATLCESPKIRALSFTGSSPVGKWLYNRCSSTMKRLSLELGGDSPFIVFPSANINVAVKAAMDSKFRNTGQACIAANRIFVHESLHDDFVSRFANAMDSLKVGNGLDPGVNQGPLINQRQMDRLEKILKETVEAGAKVVRGGSSLGGLFCAPTLLTDVNMDMAISKQEIFGPVAAVMKFKTEEEVIRLANATEMGLGGYFFSNDLSQVWRVAEALEVGLLGVNDGMMSTCEAPFGGVKHSGLGKEGSRHGMDEFTNLKYICFGV